MARSGPTSSEVAQRSGVSRSIVSVVLNGSTANSRVSDETRRRVVAVAEELGYRPNRNAQALRSRRSGVVGFVPRLDRGSTVEDTVPFILSVELARAAVRRGLHVIEASSETAQARERTELVRFLQDWQVDGVIVDSPKSYREVEQIVTAGLNLVQIFRPMEGGHTPEITVSPFKGMHQAVAHLAELGHTRIAYIGSHKPHPIDSCRIDAFHMAISGHRLDDHPGRIRLGSDYYSRTGYDEMQRLLAMRSSDRPTAVIVGGDLAAMGALRALYEAHVRVPDQMSIVSYDDSIAAYQIPALTSIAQPFGELAERALDMVLGKPDDFSDPSKEHTALVLPTRLVVRESTTVPYRP